MRKWSYYGNFNNEKPLFVGLVLADAQGNAMYAEIPEEEVATKGPLLDMNKTYVIKKFSVKNARSTYMPFEAQLMMEISCYTTIDVAKNAPDTFPACIYSLTPFSQIQGFESSSKKYIDVIGYISEIKDLTSVVPRGRDKASTLREVIIKDIDDTELIVTLWGQHAVEFNLDHLYDSTAPKVIVVLFQGCLPRNTFQKLQVSGGSACQWLLNPNIKEAQPFFTRFHDQLIHIEQPAPGTSQIQAQPIPLEHKNLEELNAMDPYDFPEQGCKCTVTVTQVPQDNTWWYISCYYCKRKADAQPAGGYYCSICKATRTLPRYKLSFVATDETAEANFFCYDDMASQILQRDCSALINKMRTAPGLPSEIAALISKRFMLAINLTSASFRSRTERKYRVDAIIDRSDRRNSTLNVPIPTPTTQALPPPTTPLAITGTSTATPPLLHEEFPMTYTDSATILTPPPSTDPEKTPSKQDHSKSMINTDQTRKKLFHSKSDDDQDDNMDADKDTHTTTTTISTTVLEPAPKRPKPGASKHTAKGAIRGTSSTNSPK